MTIRILALACSFLLSSFHLFGQAGPPAAEVNNFLVVPSQSGVVYATAGGGLFRSTDAGRTWSNRSAGLPPVSVTTVAGPTWRLYLGTAGQGVWRSVNGGVWTKTTDVFNSGTLLALAVSPNDPLFVLAATSAGLRRSRDGGETWEQTPGPSSQAAILDIAFSPFNPDKVFAVGQNRLYESSNGGQTWLESTVNLLLRRIVFDAQDPNNFYLATNSGLYRRSISGGVLSRILGFGLASATALVIDPASPNKWLAFSDSFGLLRSEDSGLTWSDEYQGLPAGFIIALAAIPDEPGRRLAAFNGTGIFSSDDYGMTWSLSSEGLYAGSVQAMAVSPTDGQTVWASLNSGGLFKTVDGGDTWVESRNGLINIAPSTIEVDPSNPNNIYVGSVDPNNIFSGNLSRSQDGGATWAGQVLLRDFRAIAVDPAASQNVLVGGSTGPFSNLASLIRSQNSAETFFSVLPPVTSWNIFDITFDPSNPNEVWAIGVVNGTWSLWFSNDGGIDFGLQPVQLSQNPLVQLVIDPTDSQRIYLATEGSGVLRTIPGQVGLQLANVGLPNGGVVSVQSLAVSPDQPNNLLIATDTGLYRSNNYGATWQLASQGLPPQSLLTVAMGIGASYVSTLHAGVFVSNDFGASWRPTARKSLETAGIVNGASFRGGGVSPGQIVSIFGGPFSEAVELAQNIPLPLMLAGAKVRITDGDGTVFDSVGLFFVSPGQINVEIPVDAKTGEGLLTVVSSNGAEATVPIEIVAVSPALFASAGTGEGPAAAAAVRVAADNSQTPVSVVGFSDGEHRTIPIEVGAGRDPVFLLLFGTGIRGFTTVKAFINGQEAPVTGIGAQTEFVGLDQVNVRIPEELAGAGVVEVYLVIDGVQTNSVTIAIQ